eukprot:6214272-Pleurochrysis_carterae.AAC.3
MQKFAAAFIIILVEPAVLAGALSTQLHRCAPLGLHVLDMLRKPSLQLLLFLLDEVLGFLAELHLCQLNLLALVACSEV